MLTKPIQFLRNDLAVLLAFLAISTEITMSPRYKGSELIISIDCGESTSKAAKAKTSVGLYRLRY